MGRRNTTGRVPQNDRRRAQREIRRALNLPFPQSFGIRRHLDEGIARTIVPGMISLKRDQDIPRDVDLRKKPHATLLPKRVFGRQALKGLLGGYNLRALENNLKGATEGSDGNGIEADMLGVSVYKGRVIYMKLESPDMQEEVEQIAAVMGALGLRGIHREKGVQGLHMSLGESRHGITPTEQRHVTHVIEEEIDRRFGLENPLKFQEWDVYPRLDQWQ